MTSARDSILGNLRRALKRDPDDTRAKERVAARLTERPRGPQPARAQLPLAEQVDLFESMAKELSASVTRVPTLQAVPQAVADYLKANNLPSRLKLAPDLANGGPGNEGLDWSSQPMLEVSSGRAEADDAVSVTGAFAAIAETGTLMLHSAADSPTSLCFLPETHVVVARTSHMVGRYEEAWDRLRVTVAEAGLPRSVNLISGPSRTADIEQTMQLGAHGPRQLHIILIEDHTD